MEEALTVSTRFSGKLEDKTAKAELCLVLRANTQLGLVNLKPVSAGIAGDEAEALNSLASIADQREIRLDKQSGKCLKERKGKDLKTVGWRFGVGG